MKAINTRVKQILQWTKGPLVLHVGCADHVVREGSDYWLHKHLIDNFPHVVGLDSSEENILSMRNLGYQNLEIGDAEEFELEDRFDTIVAGELIEHLSNPGLFFERASNHLKPGGRLVITTPYPFSLLNQLFAYTKYPVTVQNDQHSMWFCVKTLRQLYERYGFQEVHFDLIPDYEFDNPSLKYRVFIRFLSVFGFLFPKRLKFNDMLFVLEPKKELS